MSFNDLQQQLAPVATLPCLWFIGGGWAIDLFLDRETRPHSDIDLCVFREDQHAVRQHLAGYTFTYVKDGEHRPWPDGMTIELPQHEIWAKQGDTRLEFLLNEYSGASWVSRRDAAVRLPLARAVRVHRGTGLRFIAPQISLYFKAKAPRDKDTDDFKACWPTMAPEQQEWLRRQLPDTHPWLKIVA